jgi:hypothetical protein
VRPQAEVALGNVALRGRPGQTALPRRPMGADSRWDGAHQLRQGCAGWNGPGRLILLSAGQRRPTYSGTRKVAG